MKKSIASFVFFLAFPVLHNAQPSPGSWLSFVSSELVSVHKSQEEYAIAGTGTDPARAEEKRKRLLNTLSRAMVRVHNASAPAGSESLRDTLLLYFKHHYACVNEDFVSPHEMQQISRESFDAMDAYLGARRMAYRRLESLAGSVNVLAAGYAERHGIRIRARRVRAQEEKADPSVYRDYNTLYELFFACYKQESALLNAIDREDISAIEQNRGALASAARSGLAEVVRLRPRMRSPMLAACEALLSFYYREATSELRHAVTFVAARDNFVRMREELVSLPDQNVDSLRLKVFTSALLEINAKREDLVSKLGSLKKERAKLLSAWNASAASFLVHRNPDEE